MSQPEDQSELFKQAVTSTMRAISGNDELAVTFGRGKPYIQSDRARVPMPDSSLADAELAALRGASDKFALKQVSICDHGILVDEMHKPWAF